MYKYTGYGLEGIHLKEGRRSEDAMDKHLGSDFDDFLVEQGMIEQVSIAAMMRVIAWQFSERTTPQNVGENPWRNECMPATPPLIRH